MKKGAVSIERHFLCLKFVLHQAATFFFLLSSALVHSPWFFLTLFKHETACASGAVEQISTCSFMNFVSHWHDGGWLCVEYAVTDFVGFSHIAPIPLLKKSLLTVIWRRRKSSPEKWHESGDVTFIILCIHILIKQLSCRSSWVCTAMKAVLVFSVATVRSATPEAGYSAFSVATVWSATPEAGYLTFSVIATVWSATPEAGYLTFNVIATVWSATPEAGYLTFSVATVRSATPEAGYLTFSVIATVWSATPEAGYLTFSVIATVWSATPEAGYLTFSVATVWSATPEAGYLTFSVATIWSATPEAGYSAFCAEFQPGHFHRWHQRVADLKDSPAAR